MTIAEGATLGPYEILRRIGEGGMGEVWRARDQRIGREVAVKVLRNSFTHGDQRVRRFEQEARAAGALNHPGLATIYDVGTMAGSPYIVMELLEGQNLREAMDSLGARSLPLRKAVDYAIQIASALAVAHEKGIIHRDLKPENLFVTTDGRVKILDFGLAKLTANTAEEVDPNRRTAKHLTGAGTTVGTPAYMSPEQVRAQPVDHRTDIFSFGSVLYEMLAGRPAFECFSALETMNAVATVEPSPITTFAPHVPATLDAIVCHCLEKNPRARFQSARDLAFQLRTMKSDHAATAILPHIRPEPQLQPRRTIVTAVAIVLAAAAGFALRHFMADETDVVRPRKSIQLTSGDGVESFPTIAPDGKSFAYVSASSGNRDIYVQRVDGKSAMNITRDSPADDFEPAFSPDGSQIAFRSERDGGGLFVMGVTGESVRRIANFGHNPAWSPDGTRIVMATEGVDLLPYVRPTVSELWLVDLSTGTPRPLIQLRTGGPDFGRDSDAVQPSWSPSGKRIAFWGLSTWFGQRDLWTIDPDAPEPKRTVVRVTSTPSLDWNPVWSPDGRYLYYGSDEDGTLNLWRIRMHERSGEPAGTPEMVSLPATISGQFTIARGGEIAYATIARQYQLMALPFDPDVPAVTGTPRPVLSGTQEILTFQPSPDGQSIAYTTGGGIQEDLFIADANGSRLRQLTNDPAKDRSVTWSPDGNTLYFYSNRDGAYRIWSIRADGGGLTLITNDDDVRRIGARTLFSPNVSPNGRTLAIQTDVSTALVHLDRPTGRRLEPLPIMLSEPKWSPDGTKILGTDDTRTSAGIRGGVVVFSLRPQRSERIAERGVAPHWLRDGTRIAFFDQQSVGIFDLATRRTSTVPLNVDMALLGSRHRRVSRDGSTIYLLRTLEQGDIWMIRYPPPG